MALLETRDLSAFYGDFRALYGITLATGAVRTDDRDRLACLDAS
jgi:hypothetical protein